MTNCIHIYEQVATGSGEPLGVALAGLSEATGMAIDHSLWSRWRGGKRTPPPHVLREINRMIVERVLRDAGIDAGPLTDAQMDQIGDAFSPPDRQPASDRS